MAEVKPRGRGGMAEPAVIPVRSRTERRSFLEFPYRLHRGDPCWVPPLRGAQKTLFDTAKHPFYGCADAEFLLAVRNARVVGRVAAILDRNFNQFHGEQAGFFGFFECEHDLETARALLGAARGWLAARGAKVVRGPVNPSTNYECGLLVEGFDSPPALMMPHNPPYYAALIEAAGFRKAKDLYAYTLTAATLENEKAMRIAERVLRRESIRIRPISMKHFLRDVGRIWEVYNLAWSRNWGFVPMTRREFFAMSREMKPLLDPELVLVGEAAGKVVGFALALPDMNKALKHAGGRLLPFGVLKILYYKRLITSMRVVALGVVEEFRTAGIAAAFYATLIRNGLNRGYRDCEMSWVLEDNVLMNRSAEALGGRRYKTYRLYEWN